MTTKTMGRQLAVVVYWNTLNCTAAKKKKEEEEKEKEEGKEEEKDKKKEKKIFFFSKIVPFKRQCKNILHSRTGHR
jgi:hypothetical protein